MSLLQKAFRKAADAYNTFYVAANTMNPAEQDFYTLSSTMAAFGVATGNIPMAVVGEIGRTIVATKIYKRAKQYIKPAPKAV